MSKALPIAPLETHEFFAGYPAIWQQMKPGVRTCTMHKGDTVLHHGDAAQTLWLVHHGWVKLVRQTPDGKETVAGLCTHGDMFGEAALFPHASYPYTAEALEDGTELYAIPADSLRHVLKTNAGFSTTMMAMLNRRIAQTQLKLEHMSTMSATQRLGCFLLGLCREPSASDTTLQIPVEKHILASYLGMKPETLSRSQQQMKTIGVDVKGFTVNVSSIARLREFVCSSCSESGNCEADLLGDK